jgi:hypothetical protein
MVFTERRSLHCLAMALQSPQTLYRTQAIKLEILMTCQCHRRVFLSTAGKQDHDLPLQCRKVSRNRDMDMKATFYVLPRSEGFDLE